MNKKFFFQQIILIFAVLLKNVLIVMKEDFAKIQRIILTQYNKLLKE